MDISSFPLVLLLLLPGFLAIQVFFLVTRSRNLSTFQATTWSLIVSLVLVFGIYPAYTHFIEPPPGKSWPGALETLANSTLVPGLVWLLLYVSALLVGVLLGIVDRKGLAERLLRRVGIDLKLHGDVWGRLFRLFNEPGYTEVQVQVYLHDGSVLSGWPEYYSSDRSQPGPELYLTQVRVWNAEQLQWVELARVQGVLIDAGNISRIEFPRPTEGNGIPEVAP